MALLMACEQTDRPELRYIGDIIEPDGSVTPHEIRPFELVDQLGRKITNEDLKGNIHLVDFFFTSCPSICPKVTKQMLRLYDHVEEMDDVLLISHTIDPKRDSVAVLKLYADNLSIDHTRWLFLTGDKDEIMDLANEDYFVAAMESPDAPGGFDHSGKILLLDKDARIRGFCEGTDPESVDQMMLLIDELGKTYE